MKRVSQDEARKRNPKFFAQLEQTLAEQLSAHTERERIEAVNRYRSLYGLPLVKTNN